jgi:hypothetical protein
VGQTTQAAIQAKYTIGFSASVRRQQLLHKRIQKLELEPGSLVKQDLQFLKITIAKIVSH